jgi:hypothetical protein
MLLNNLEKALLGAIIEDNRLKYPFLEKHFGYLYVLSREFTGVGMYVNFAYGEKFNANEINNNINIIPISSHKSLIFDGFQYELSYELSVSNGKILCWK